MAADEQLKQSSIEIELVTKTKANRLIIQSKTKPSLLSTSILITNYYYYSYLMADYKTVSIVCI
jgi:hypothetical protein